MSDIKTVYLQAVLMPNGEVIHYGATLGWFDRAEYESDEPIGAPKHASGIVVRLKPKPELER